MHACGMLGWKNCRFARMSSGRYCLIRDLGLVKGGKGLRHHEVVLDLSLLRVCRGVFRFATSALRAQAVWQGTGWQGSAAKESASEPVLAAQVSRRSQR